jgi:hypothetical protein
MLLLVCNGQNGNYVVLKTQKKKKFTILRAKCVYKLSKPAAQVAFDIGFDVPTDKFKVTIQLSELTAIYSMYMINAYFLGVLCYDGLKDLDEINIETIGDIMCIYMS